MALAHIIEKLSGSSQSWSLPIFVYDDGGASITLDDVVAHINAAVDIPTAIYGMPDDGDPNLTQLSHSAWRITIKYRLATLRPLRPPLVGADQRIGFEFHLPRKYVRFAPEVGKFPSGVNGCRGIVNIVSNGHSLAKHSGVWLDPPPISFKTTLSVHPDDVTPSWARTIAAVIQAGCSNSSSMQAGAYAAGELLIVHCAGAQISEKAVQIETGWNWKQNVSDETRGEVTGVSYDGQDFVWDWVTNSIDRESQRYEHKITAVYVNRVRPRVDMHSLGILPA